MAERSESKKTAERVWYALGVIGAVLFFYALNTLPAFNPSVPLFAQPYWWVLLGMAVTNPRMLPIYYLLRAEPPLPSWVSPVIVGCILFPRAWALWMFTGGSAALGFKLTLGFFGLYFDALEDKVISEKLGSNTSTESSLR